LRDNTISGIWLILQSSEPSELLKLITFQTFQHQRVQVLESLRAFAGQPIIISSGYRCRQLNVKVGGAYASQHTLGEAADIYIPKTVYTDWSDNKAYTDKKLGRKWMEWIIDNTDFDQCI
jgi:hypothetical protein